MQDNYLRAMKADSALARQYFSKSIVKTQQQEALESLLLDSISRGELEQNAPYTIADLACGGGTLSYHLASFFPNARFVLLDYNDEALSLAREINAPFIKRMRFIQGDLRALPLDSSAFDMVFCWQSLGWVEREDIEGILKEMMRILREGGRVYASSLFNTEFDVDLYTTICDRTRPSSINHANPKAPLNNGNYNTYCLQTLRDMCGELVRSLEVVPFYASGDLERDLTQRGIGSFTYNVVPSSLGAGHSALSDKSAILRSDFRLRTSSARPQSSLESPDFSSQILECQGESLPKDSENISESTASDSHSLQTLESKADSKRASAVGHSSTAIKSHSGDKRSVSPTLEALSGWGDCPGGRERPPLTPAPPPLTKEKEILSNNRILEVKAKDSQAIDSESKRQAESARALDSKQQDSDSKNLESAIDSESKIPYNTGAGYHPQHNTTQHNTISAPNHIRRYAAQLGDTYPHQVSAPPLPRTISPHAPSRRARRALTPLCAPNAYSAHLTHEQNARAKEAV